MVIIIIISSLLLFSLSLLSWGGRWLWSSEDQPPSLGDRCSSSQEPFAILLYSPNLGRPKWSSASMEPASFTDGALEREGLAKRQWQWLFLLVGKRAGTWAHGPLDITACLMCPLREERSRWSCEEALDSKVSMGSMEQKRKPPTCHTAPGWKAHPSQFRECEQKAAYACLPFGETAISKASEPYSTVLWKRNM